MASIANGLIEYIKTDNGIHAIASSAYGICDDLASTQIKTVNIPGFKLEEGVTIHVKFENGNTASLPKLNINNHANEDIDIESVSGVSIDTLEPGAMLTLTYDGTAWIKDYGDTGSGGDNVDLTGVMRVIGIVDPTSEYQPSHLSYGTPTILDVENYSPELGDVIATINGLEFMYTSSGWYIVGHTGIVGDSYTPVYLNNGVFSETIPLQKCNFTIANAKTGVSLQHAAFNAKSYVTQIVVESGKENLNSPIEWESFDGETAGTINLSCAITTSGAVSGYILVGRGGVITATTTNIPNT